MAISSNYHKPDETLYFTALRRQLFAGGHKRTLDVSESFQSAVFFFFFFLKLQRPIRSLSFLTKGTVK